MENDTIFHKIINKELPAEIVYEDEKVIAFKDINPVSNVHILIVPKKTIPSLKEIQSEDRELLGSMLLTANKLAKDLEVESDGYRVVINCGEKAGQTVFQLHMHLLAGREFSWPPG